MRERGTKRERGVRVRGSERLSETVDTQIRIKGEVKWTLEH